MRFLIPLNTEKDYNKNNKKIKFNNIGLIPFQIDHKKNNLRNNKFKSKTNKIYENSFCGLFILVFVLSLVLNAGSDGNLVQKLNYIEIKIKGTGYQNIASPSYQHCPVSIKLNEDEGDVQLHHCTTIYIPPANEEINKVKIILNENTNSLNNLFLGLNNITEVDLSHYDTSSIIYMSNTFKNCESLTSINFGNINTQSLENIESLFYDCFSLIELDLSSFNTSKVTNIRSLFHGCNKLEKLELGNFNTSLVESMNCLFCKCSSIKNLSLNGFDTSKVTDMGFMFYECSSLTSLNLSTFNTISLKDISHMFRDAQNLILLDLSNFDTSKVTSIDRLFRGCSSLTSLDLSSFNTSEVVNMIYTFYKCTNLQSLNLSNFETPKLQYTTLMFSDCSSLTSLDISNFNTSQITDMSSLFKGCNQLVSINLSSFDTSNVENMESMFEQCNSLVSLNLSNFRTGKVRKMNNMFKNCKVLEFLDISIFDTTIVSTMNNMFSFCEKLSSLDLSSFNTQFVNDLEYMFYSCSALKSLNLSNFITPELTSMISMFYGCSSLDVLDISNLDTRKVYDMNFIFSNCNSLTFLDLSNFDTSNVKNMNHMFSNCSSLTSLDLTSFNTSQVTTMDFMFSYCSNLTIINLSSFETPLLNDVSKMFYSCEKLEFINFQKYNESIDINIDEILYDTSDNIIFCLNLANHMPKLMELINSNPCYNIYCGDDWLEHKKKRIADNDTCVENCSNFKYEHNNICYKTCPEGVEFCTEDDNIITTNIETIDNTSLFEKSEYSYESSLNITFKELLNEYSNNTDLNITLSEFYNEESSSINITLNTYLDFKSETINDSSIIENVTNKVNGISNTFLYTSSLISEIETDINIEPERDITTNINYPLTSQIYETTQSLLNSEYNIIELNLTIDEKNQRKYEEIINLIFKNFSNNDEEIIIEGEDNFLFQLTNLKHDLDILEGKNNNSNKMSIIDLGDCENELKEHYNINKSESLLILKYEKKSNSSIDRSIQYEVYDPKNKEKLNMTICQDLTINIYVPIALSPKLQNLYNELKDLGYDLFDINNEFYQDICTPYKSENGTDVSLSDRINYYHNNEETTCQSNCKSSDFLIESQYLKCECDISNSEIQTDNARQFTAKSFFKSFFDVLKFSNYKVLKCYKLAFRLNAITSNIGSISTIILFLIYFIFVIIYYIKGSKELMISFEKVIIQKPQKESEKHLQIYPEEKINKIKNKKDFSTKETIKIKKNKSNNKDKHELDTLNIKNDKKNIKQKYDKKIDIKKQKKNNIHKKDNSIIINNKRKSILRRSAEGTTKLGIQNPPKKYKMRVKHSYTINGLSSYNNSNFKVYSDENNLNTKNNKDNNFKEIKNKIKNETHNEKKTGVEEIFSSNEKNKLDNYELNNLDYDEAIKYDKRNFIQIYWSILKREHLLLFTFFIRNDHNITYIKFDRFIFLVCTDMAMNVFFFADETMHKMFLDYGKYNFIQQIPQIIYSTLVSNLIEVFLCYLSLTDKDYYQIKKIKAKKANIINHIIKCVKLKINFFFIFTIIVFIFYWYIISCFCAVYQNTQSAFIKDSLLSFCLGLLYPLCLYLIPSILRIFALSSKKGKLGFVYKLSDIIPIF